MSLRVTANVVAASRRSLPACSIRFISGDIYIANIPIIIKIAPVIIFPKISMFEIALLKCSFLFMITLCTKNGIRPVIPASMDIVAFVCGYCMMAQSP